MIISKSKYAAATAYISRAMSTRSDATADRYRRRAVYLSSRSRPGLLPMPARVTLRGCCITTSAR